MKQRLMGLLLATLMARPCPAQEIQYRGSFSASGSDASNAVFYTNVLKVTVLGDEAVAIINVKAGPKSEPDDYFTFEGTLKGTLTPTGINVTGTIHMALMDASRTGDHFREEDVPGELSGTGSNGVFVGSLYVTVGGRKESNMQFTLRTKEMAPVLLFPLGKSPKVFDKGWLFGAEFTVMDKNGEIETDLSDKIEWSGTGTFEPSTGATSRPEFNSPGANKIILTVEYEGKKYKKEYPVITVDADMYARLGCMAICPADGHGSLSDPLTTIGMVITGNGNVLINGLPAVCVDDRGKHAACAGPNTFVIASGDPEVLINGKRAANLLWGKTRHCGGMGQLISLEGSLISELTALSKDVTFTGKDGNKVTPGNKLKTGTKMVTGPKGLVLMSPDKNTVMMVLPNSEAVINNDNDRDLIIGLENGSIMVNGEQAANNRNLVIENFNEKLVREGTRFLYTVSKEYSRLIVYEGEVKVFLKKEDKRITVAAGKVYINDLKNPYTISDTTQFQSADVLLTIPKDSAGWQLPKQETTKENVTAEKNDLMALLKKYWYAGAIVVVLLLLVFMIKRKKKQEYKA